MGANSDKPRLGLRFIAPAALFNVTFASQDAALRGAIRRGLAKKVWCVELPNGGWRITHVQ